MYYLYYDDKNATNTKAMVTNIYYSNSPNSGIMNKPYVELNDLPNEDINVVGKRSVPYVNPQTGEFWYEYVDRPLTDSEKLSQLQAENAQINYALMMGGLV